MQSTVIDVQNISKSFHVGVQNVPVLKNISFQVKKGDFLIIFGPSGCGKSTLLHAMLGLEAPTTGKVMFLQTDLYAPVVRENEFEGRDELSAVSHELQSEDDRSEFRKLHIGMVYQQPNWIKSLTVIENVMFPLLLLGEPRGQSSEKASAMLRTVGMEQWSSYVPTELSSGQQQKIALARALITNPEVIIADEPTGNLDFNSGEDLMKLLGTLNKEQEKTIIMVTHDLDYLVYAKTALRMFNGEIIGQYGEKDHNKLLREIKSKRR